MIQAGESQEKSHLAAVSASLQRLPAGGSFTIVLFSYLIIPQVNNINTLELMFAVNYPLHSYQICRSLLIRELSTSRLLNLETRLFKLPTACNLIAIKLI